MAVGPSDVLCGRLGDGVRAVSRQKFLLALLANVLAGSEIVVGVEFAVVAQLAVLLGGGVRALRGEADGRLARQAVFGEEVEALEFLYGRPLVRLFLQDAGDERLQVRGGVHGFWEGKGALLDFLVGVLDIFGLERRASVDQSVNDDSDAPHIDFVAVPLRLQYLWSDVIGRSADGLLLLPVEINARGQSEIPDLDVHMLVEEQVAQFQIPMDDLLSVQVLKPLQHLQHEVLHLALREPALSLYQIVEGLSKGGLTLLVQSSSTMYTFWLSSKLWRNLTTLGLLRLSCILISLMSWIVLGVTLSLERCLTRVDFWMILTAKTSLVSSAMSS